MVASASSSRRPSARVSGQIVGHEALAFAGFVAPEEDAFEVGVAIDEQGFLGRGRLG